MRIGKNTVAYILIFALLFSVFGTTVTAEETTEAADVPQVLFKYTGDEADDSSFVNTVGDCKIVKPEDGTDNAMSFSTVSSLYAHIGRNTPIETGSYVISWDFKTSSAKGMSYIRMYSGFHTVMSSNIENEMFETMMWYLDGRVGPFKQFDGWSLDGQTKTYEANKWYHYDLWVDVDNKIGQLYIDGERTATVNITDTFERFCGFSITAAADGEAITDYVDNIYIGYVPKNGYKTGFDFCKAIPAEIESSVNVSLSTDQIGNIFFDKTGDLKVSLGNPYDKDRNLEISCSAITDTGRVEYEETRSVKLAPTETLEEVFKFSVNEYGFYHTYIDVVDKDTGEIISKETRFSVLNSPKQGVLNKKYGLNTHFNNGRGTDRTDDLTKLYADAGFYSIREGMDMNLCYGFNDDAPRDYSPETYVVNRLNAVKNNNQQSFAIIGWATMQANQKHLPETASELARWKDYVKNVALAGVEYGFTDYELLNEINIKTSDTITVEDYVNLMKETYGVLHQYNPNARLFVFGTANVNATDFIEKCFELGCADYMDGASIHPYNALYRPDEDKFLTDVQDVKDLMEKYGVGDLPIVFSEFGWTSGQGYVSEEEQARYTVRSSALVFDDAEYINWYNDIEKVDLTQEGELHFGMLRGFRGQDINYEAKPVFAAASNYNAFAAEAVSNGQVKIFNEGGYVCKFKDTDDSDIYMIWKIRDRGELKLNIGAEKATVYDMYGNSNTIYTEDGVLNLSVSEDPQYVTGNFTACEEITDAAGFECDDKIEVALNDSFDLVIKNRGEDKGYTTEADLPYTMGLVQESGFENGKAYIKVKTGSESCADEKVRVNVKDKNGNIIWHKEIDVEYIEAATVDFTVKYYKSSRWQGVLKVTNNKNEEAISGVLNVKSPETLANYVNGIEIEKIEPHQTGIVEFNIPTSEIKDFIEFEGLVDFDDGQRIEVKESSYFVSLMPIKGTPKVDGVIEQGEYNTEASLQLNKERMVTPVPGTKWDWSGAEDLSAAGYINYDKDYFYLAFEVTDDILGDNDEQERIWANDSIQFAFVAERRQGAGITEIGIGLVNGEPRIERYSFLGEKQNILYNEAIGKKDGFNDDTELAIVRNGNKTVYELKVSWEDIYGIKTPFAMRNVYFSMIVNENDTKGRMGWLEFAPGIGSNKKETVFTKVPVVR